MTVNQIEFGGDDKLALDYIKQRGYASYSSMTMVRDKRAPEPFKVTEYYTFGKELHSRFLEHKKLETLSPANEKLLKIMINKLSDDPMVQKIMEQARCEQDFKVKINGLTVIGRIDILTFAVGDLKTTRLKSKNAFIDAMDFLQAAIYLRATKLKDFYYIGASKEPPYDIFIFNVLERELRLYQAQKELEYLTKYIKPKL